MAMEVTASSPSLPAPSVYGARPALTPVQSPALAALGANRFISGLGTAEVYFEDTTRRTKHLVRFGCRMCSSPMLCEHPETVTVQYVNSLRQAMDFECDMMLSGATDQGDIPSVVAAPVWLPVTTPFPWDTLHATTTMLAGSLPEDGSSPDFVLVGILVILLLACCAASGVAAWHFLKGGNSRHKGKGAAKARQQDHRSGGKVQEKVPLISAQPAPTMVNLGQWTGQDQLPGTLRALAVSPTGGLQQAQQQLQQQQTYIAPIGSVMKLQSAARSMSGPVDAAAAGPTADPSTSIISPQLFAFQQPFAVATMPTYYNVASITQAQDYDVVTVTPDGFSVMPLQSAAMPPSVMYLQGAGATYQSGAM